MIRFTRANWARFATHGKTTTIRTNGGLKRGEYVVFSGPRFKPEEIGTVKIDGIKKACKVKLLTKKDALADGFNSRDELLFELARLNKELTLDSFVYVYRVARWTSLTAVVKE